MATMTESPPQSRTQIQAQVRADVERRRSDAEQQARRSFDRDAVAAIEDTRQAVQALAADNKPDDALAAIERATGKLDVLLTRNPQAALLPVDARVRVIDRAPEDLDEVRRIGGLAEAAVLVDDYPMARVMLASLVSEIRIRTLHLPLGTYPAALREAVRLINAQQADEARAVLEAALNALVVADRIIPLPLVLAEAAVAAAESVRDDDRETAVALLGFARHELERSMDLGYQGRDEEYKTLRRTISDLEKHLRRNENGTDAFTKLRERMSAFFNRLTGSDKSIRSASSSAGGGDGAKVQQQQGQQGQQGQQQQAR